MNNINGKADQIVKRYNKNWIVNCSIKQTKI